MSDMLWQVLRYGSTAADVHVMRDRLSEPEARQLVRVMEAKGHKQTYVAEPMMRDDGTFVRASR